MTSCVTIRKRPTPIAISGVMNEKSIVKFAEPAPRPRQRSSAIANATPSGTAIRTTRIESLKLWASADRSSGSWNTEFTSWVYQRLIENPCHVVCAFPALNENMTAITTGTIVQTTYAIAPTHRNRACAQGFRIQASNRRQALGRSSGQAGAHRSASSRAIFVLRR